MSTIVHPGAKILQPINHRGIHDAAQLYLEVLTFEVCRCMHIKHGLHSSKGCTSRSCVFLMEEVNGQRNLSRFLAENGPFKNHPAASEAHATH